ncbi:MAG TPA: CBS domain-containing protein [Candidatus Sulfobium mesophilum]|uniref:Putative CBS domain containing membrane protein n=1 Tax=Candidatus Sulfobium mesophilum TaxID=2016548 RepID=A0A2U3QE41_9BACT|nr:putative CBS domain containing membrane protein [Candidatus Sulfobium mesophilum]HSB30536.1 CBS domain-containing protein [Candidatus Sulfobium mesophilum]
MDVKAEISEISGEDLRAALSDMGTYVDITEEDLLKIYSLAVRHAKERMALSIKVSEVMTADAVAVNEDADIAEAIKLLSDKGVSGLPVTDNENHVVGVITEADILSVMGMNKGHTFKDIIVRLLGEPAPGNKSGNTVRQVMSSPAITTTPDRRILEVASILEERRIKRLPVVEAAGKLIGIISRADIVRAVAKK